MLGRLETYRNNSKDLKSMSLQNILIQLQQALPAGICIATPQQEAYGLSSQPCCNLSSQGIQGSPQCIDDVPGSDGVFSRLVGSVPWIFFRSNNSGEQLPPSECQMPLSDDLQ
jgi:hypothetical protein